MPEFICFDGGYSVVGLYCLGEGYSTAGFYLRVMLAVIFVIGIGVWTLMFYLALGVHRIIVADYEAFIQDSYNQNIQYILKDRS